MERLHLLFMQQGPSILNQMLPFLLIIVVMYFFFIRPQSKKQKEQLKFSDDLQKGDEIVTTSGILGKVTKLEDNIVTIEVSPKTYLRLTRSAISKELTDETYKTNKS